MKLEHTEDSSGMAIVNVFNDEGGFEYSMPKSVYDAKLAEQSTPIMVEHLTEIPTKEAYLATLASELSNPSTPQAGE
jgi:ribosomal protein L10